MAGDDHRHRHRHRRRGAGDLRPRAAEHRGKEPHRNGAVQPGGRPQPRRHAERQRNRQRHHRRREAAEHVSAQRVEVVLHRLCVLNLDTSSGTISAEPNPC